MNRAGAAAWSGWNGSFVAMAAPPWPPRRNRAASARRGRRTTWSIPAPAWRGWRASLPHASAGQHRPLRHHAEAAAGSSPLAAGSARRAWRVRARAKLFEQTQQPTEKTPPLLQRGASGAGAAPPTRAAGSRASLAMRGPGSTKSCAALFEQKQRDSALEAMGAPPSPRRNHSSPTKPLLQPDSSSSPDDDNESSSNDS